MKKLFVVATLVACIVALPMLAASKEKVKQQRSVTRFERIKLVGAPTIRYQQGTTCSVTVIAPRELVDKVETRVTGGRLVVGMKGNSSGVFNFSGLQGNGVTVVVTSPDLIGVELIGSGDFKCTSPLDTDTLDILLRGSGDMDFGQVVCDQLNASLVGSGDLELKQVTTQRADLEVVGSGDLELALVQSRRTVLTVKGSGDAKLTLTDCGTLDCTLLGSGDVTLRGTVRQCRQQSRGSGDIDAKALIIRKK